MAEYKACQRAAGTHRCGYTRLQKALEECGEDVEKAIDYLREKSIAKAAKKPGLQPRD